MKRELLPHLIVKARRSGFWLFVLNLLMARTIPFNSPHKFRISEMSDEHLRTFAPYRKSNFNHIRGIHACAIATVAEFSAGFLLLTKLDPSKYRLIMGRLDADYTYQAKEDIIALAELTSERLHEEVLAPLEQGESTEIVMTTVVSDVSGNEVAEVRTTWQVKRWDRVKTKV